MATRPDIERNIKLGLAAAVTASALFSAKSVFYKLCFRYGTPPVVLQSLRGLFSLPFFVGPFVLGLLGKGGAGKPAFGFRDILLLAALGFTGYYLASLCDMVGLQFVSAGTERLILYVYPTLVILFSALLFRKPIARALYAPLALSYAGIALSFGGEATAGGGNAAYGGFLVFLSAIFYALFLVGQGKWIHRYGPRFFTAACMLFAFFAFFTQFLAGYPLSALVQPRPVVMMAAFTAVFCNVAPTYLFAYAVKLAGSGPTAVAGTVGPVSTLVLSAFLLGERPGWHQWLGLGLVVAGALRLSAPAKPAPQASSPAPAGGTPPASGSRRRMAPELSDPAASAAAFLASSRRSRIGFSPRRARERSASRRA